MGGDRHVPSLYQRHGLREPRPGYYSWDDRDGDVEAALEPFPDHPTIIATLSIVRDNGMHGGVHIDRQQAHDIIEWLSAQLSHEQRSSSTLPTVPPTE